MRYPGLGLRFVTEDPGWVTPGPSAPQTDASRGRIATIALFGDPSLAAPVEPTAAAALSNTGEGAVQ